MYRTHNCGELRITDVNKNVRLAGWIQKVRDKGGMVWIDLRDRYGITQLIFEEGVSDPDLLEYVKHLHRESVVQVTGEVTERYSKNKEIPTGEIEIKVNRMDMLNDSLVPPFTIEDDTDGGEDLRMKYRYLDLRRNNVRQKLELRHRMMQATRAYLDQQNFMEVETPVLIKSTPEGARDFVVPSRLHPGEFYALPQSPQTFKQLLMVSGFDRYFQLVKCFRDEDLRADRQPEFTQIDCEMAFVEQEDILDTFEGLIKNLFKEVKGINLPDFPRMSYEEAMEKYGTDKPDLRFGMAFETLNELTRNKGFKVFDDAELVVGINAKECAGFTRKDLDGLTEFVKKPQIGAQGLVYVKYNEDGTLKSSVDKFFTREDLLSWCNQLGAQPGDLLLIIADKTQKARHALSELRLHLGKTLGLIDSQSFKPLWVLNFPLLEWDEETERYHAMHHPFTSPKKEDISLLETDPGKVRANAYDMVINGVEIGGGSIRIHNNDLQRLMFSHLGFTQEEAEEKFGFLMEAFQYGAPPHGGIAFGFDRLCALFGGSDSIRDYIAFPKNNAGRDVMIDTPSPITRDQLDELSLEIKKTRKNYQEKK